MNAALGVRTYGVGPRLILGVHGWGGGAEAFEPLTRLVGHDATIFAVDLPGYGQTPAIDACSLPAVVDALVATIDTMPAGPISLVGNCSGAIFGAMAVMKRPERFDRLIFIDPFAYTPWYLSLFLWPVVGRLFYDVTFANSWGRLITNLGLSSKRDAQTHMTASFAELDHDVVYRYLQLLDDAQGVKTLAPLAAFSIAIAIGERSFRAVRRSSTMFKEVWPDVRISTLAAGHLPIQEATEGIASIILAE